MSDMWHPASAVLGSHGKRTRLPLRRIFDVLRGRVRWFPGSGWCDQGLVDIIVHPVPSPTVEQLKFVQSQRPYLGNLLQVRRALQVGDCFGYGALQPHEVAQAEARLQELGLPYTIKQSPIWRPLTDEESTEVTKASSEPRIVTQK